MMMKFAVAMALLSAVQTSAKLVRGGADKKGNAAWAFRMNEAPALCTETFPQTGYCTPQNMWHKFGDKEYFVVEDYNREYKNKGNSKMDYAEAENFCRTELEPVDLNDNPITMLSIHSEAERDFVVSLQVNNRHGVWLGIERSHDKWNKGTKKQQGFLQYNDNTTFDFFSWANGEPNSPRYGTNCGKKKGQHSCDLVDQYIDSCVFMGINKGNPGVFNDAPCTKKRRVVCQRKIQTPFELSTCNGLEDPKECSYYGALCFPTDTNAQPWFETCPVKCNTCDQTTTTFLTTTTTKITSTSTFVTSSSTVETTSTSVVTTTTSLVTTTSSLVTTTTSLVTTTTSLATSTSTQFESSTTSTTAEPTTSTTAVPTTVDQGVCSSKRGWENQWTDPATGTTCCYKYNSKPRLHWADAEAACNAIGDEYDHIPLSSGHLATPWNPEINDLLRFVRDQKDGKSNAETAWIGGNIYPNTDPDNTDANVQWVNDIFAEYNGNYGRGAHTNGSTNALLNGSYCNDIDDKNENYQFDAANSFQYPNGDNRAQLNCNDAYRQQMRTLLLSVREQNGMFYNGEPSGKNMNSGKRGVAEECLMMGGSKKTLKEVGDNYWNDGKCATKRSYFCEYCFQPVTTTTVEPDTTTTITTSTTTVEPTTITTTTSITSTTTTSVTTTTTSTITTTTTTTLENTTTTSAEPTTSTSAEPDCSVFGCASDCGDVYIKGDKTWESACGWSKKLSACILGGRTTKKELGMGDCTVNQTTVEPVKTTPIFQKCDDIYCSMQCQGNCVKYGLDSICLEYECGWSRKHDRCMVAPAKTNEYELTTPLGPKCDPI